MTQLAIVIVNYNSTGDLLRCLAGIREDPAGNQVQVIVVDNASEGQPGLQDQLRPFSPELLLNGKNEGFGRACNRGIRHSSAPFLLLLNPDVVPHKGAIDKSLRYLKGRRRTGIVGCRVLNPDGSLQLACRRSIPTVGNSLYRFLGLSRLFPRNRKFGAYNLTYLDEDETHEIEAVSGSFLMFRRELADEIGLLDERFFLYGEDLDFCYRTLLAGWRVEYYAAASVTHRKGRSSDQNAATNTVHFFEAMKIFYSKHYAPAAHPLKTRLVMAGKRLSQYLTTSPRVASRR